MVYSKSVWKVEFLKRRVSWYKGCGQKVFTASVCFIKFICTRKTWVLSYGLSLLSPWHPNSIGMPTMSICCCLKRIRIDNGSDMWSMPFKIRPVGSWDFEVPVASFTLHFLCLVMESWNRERFLFFGKA